MKQNREYKNIELSFENEIARLTLNRPPLNVLSIEMMVEINGVIEDLTRGIKSKALLIDAKGKYFSAGVDVGEHTKDKVSLMIEVFHQMFRLLWNLRNPIIAVVQGPALGGGCELAAFCDFILASEKATFGQPEIKVGVFPPVAGVMFPRIVGLRKTMELLLLGEIIDAKEAERIGLVNKVVSDEKLNEETRILIQNICEKSGVVLGYTKRAILDAIPWQDGLKVAEKIYLEELMKTEDANEGLQAFLEKRKPVWKDK